LFIKVAITFHGDLRWQKMVTITVTSV